MFKHSVNLKMYVCIYAGAIFIGQMFPFFSENKAWLAFLSTMSAIFVFSVSSLVSFYCAHRHDNCKNTVNSVVYDAIYGIVLKYLILIFLLIFYFKFIKIAEIVFITVFVYLIVSKNFLAFKLYNR